LEKRRTWSSFGLATGIGMTLTLVLLLGGEHLLQQVFKDTDTARDVWPYLLVGLEGLCVGVVLGFLVDYYPSLEGFLSSLVVVGRLVVRDGYQVGLDNCVEFLLKFEAHFAALYLAAFVLFLVRGGGLYYPFLVGMRYLRFKVITSISVAGVALGVAAMVVVLSVMSGFETDLKAKIVGTNAHAIVQKRGTDFIEYPIVLEKIRRIPGVVAASPFVYNEVMVSSEYNISGVFIKGIDPDTAGAVTNLDRSIDEGDLIKKAPGGIPGLPDGLGGKVPPPEPLSIKPRSQKTIPGIFIGKELKKILKVSLGDRVNVVSPLSEELGPSGPVPMARSFRVAGVFYTGMYEYDAKSIYVTLASAQDFFSMGDAVTGIGLKFNNLDRAGPICADILSALDGYPYFTRTWYQMNKNLFTALKMEKIGMFILVVIVTLVSAFGIISTLIMLVWEKVKEIAILKSMGATGDGVMKIFMLEGITIGMVGTILGLLMGWGMCELLQSIGLQLDPEVYYIEGLPVNMDAVGFALIAGIAFHISFIATIYPSRRASRLRPAEGLRYD
jgi:lipoprotein-releasing system permease protein